MPLKYSGSGDPFSASVIIYGDGTSTAITLELNASPFNINFGQNTPSLAVLANPADNQDVTVGLDVDKLDVTFSAPPPAVQFGDVNPGLGRRELSIRFVYG